MHLRHMLDLMDLGTRAESSRLIEDAPEKRGEARRSRDILLYRTRLFTYKSCVRWIMLIPLGNLFGTTYSVNYDSEPLAKRFSPPVSFYLFNRAHLYSDLDVPLNLVRWQAHWRLVCRGASENPVWTLSCRLDLSVANSRVIVGSGTVAMLYALLNRTANRPSLEEHGDCIQILRFSPAEIHECSGPSYSHVCADSMSSCNRYCSLLKHRFV